MIDTSTRTSEVSAFAELFASQCQALVRLAGLLGADDPEDIVQEAFACLHSRRLRDDGAALGYLRVTVCNLTRKRLRHLRVARLCRIEPSGPMPSSEHIAIVSEEHRELLAALDGLPRRQREVLVLRYWLDLSEREIAEAMGVSPGSVKTHASRGIAALSKVLETS